MAGRMDPTIEQLLRSLPTINDTEATAAASCDWPESEYAVFAEPAIDPWTWRVTHDLSRAPGLEDLITEGAASYAVEVLCPESMYREVFEGGSCVEVRLDEHSVFGSLLMFPGVVTTRPCEMDPSGTGWEPLGPLGVPAGRWLAKAAPLTVVPEAYDPLVFRPRPDMDPPHRFSVSYSLTPDLHFVVEARPDRIDAVRCGNHAALLFCWSTALAMMPSILQCAVEPQTDGSVRVPGSRMADGLARILLSEGLELWDDGSGVPCDGWDPVAAASVQVKVPSVCVLGEHEEV